jgi:hypothetical protein
MKPGDPVRVLPFEKCCRVDAVTGTMTETVCGMDTYCYNLTGDLATHRQDGTAHPLCKVCWPDGEVG